MQPNFIISNWQRQYPFRAGQGYIDFNNQSVPTDIIVGLRLTCVASDLDVYIDKIVTKNYVVGVSLSGSNGPIGYASSLLTDSNQSILIKSYNTGGVIGNVTIGNLESAKSFQSFKFNNTNGLVEGSCLSIIPPPAVTNLAIKGNYLTGRISLTSSSLAVDASSTINISVIDPGAIQSRRDTNAEYLTCDNLIIGGINGVVPDSNNNINICAIAPLQITYTTINGISVWQFTTPGLDLTNLCKPVNLPPINPSNTYYTPLSGATNPEWTGWAQYS
jgi:hypothetical protein